jgi:ADP-ribose pyrophosphatase YjhB (NUDIX family)
MEIEIYDQNIDKEDTVNLPHRVACRGIIEKDGKYLVVHLAKYDITTFPGGGLEEGETLEECTVREVLEETGVNCIVKEKTCTIKEYYTDSRWTQHYFLCEIVDENGVMKYTDEEKSLEMHVKWMTMGELLNEFENNMTKHEYGPNIHNREFLGFINSI